MNLQIFQGCFFKKLAFFGKTVNEPMEFGSVGRVGQVRRVGREMMVDEVTTWFLGSWGGYSKFREFEESTFRGFDNSWTYGPVELFACGLFKLGVLLYLGGVICKKSSLFS